MPKKMGINGRTKEFREQFEKEQPDQVIQQPPVDPIEEKRALKNQLKREVRKKFIVGRKYELKESKSVRGDRKIFILKKFVYSVENRKTNILVMKQISGYNNTPGCLTKHDCVLLHIKYEPGLQVWPMELKWRLCKDDGKQ